MPIRNGAIYWGASASGTVQSALFLDSRDNSSAGRCATADKWYPRLFNVTEFNRIPTYVTLLTYPITEASTVSDYFKVAGDVTTYFPVGRWFDVSGSTGNDSNDVPYVVTGVSYAAGYTTISVAVVASAVADGTISAGHFKFLQSENYVIRGTVSAYQTNGTSVRLANITDFTYTSGYVNVEGATKTDGLGSGYGYSGNDVAISLPYITQITPAVNAVYEVQMRTDAAEDSVHTMGSTSSGSVRDVHATIEITL